MALKHPIGLQTPGEVINSGCACVDRGRVVCCIALTS